MASKNSVKQYHSIIDIKYFPKVLIQTFTKKKVKQYIH